MGLCKWGHRSLTRGATLINMAIQHDVKKERDARVNKLSNQLRAAEQRALLKRGIELWTSTENATLHIAHLPAAKSH